MPLGKEAADGRWEVRLKSRDDTGFGLEYPGTCREKYRAGVLRYRRKITGHANVGNNLSMINIIILTASVTTHEKNSIH